VNCIVDFVVIQPGNPTIANAQCGKIEVLAIALLKDQLFVTRNSIAEVSVYDRTSLQLTRQLTFTELGGELMGLATCSTNNYLYVSDFTNECIHRVDLSSVTDGNNATKWSVAPNYPRGLSLNPARHLLVACSNTKRIQEYTADGSLVREISDINHLWQAVELDSGMLAVSRWGPDTHGIATVSMDGQVIHSYGSEAGSGVGQMYEPRCIGVDKDGYILVADMDNDRILLVNPTLKDSRQLPLPADTSLEKPRALCLDQSGGRLYVGEYGGQNRLLVIENVTNIRAMFNK